MQSFIQSGRYNLRLFAFVALCDCGQWAAAEGTLGRVPSVEEASTFLDSQGYGPASTTLLLVWTELERANEELYITGYRVQPVGGGAPFDLYSSAGHLLNAAEREAFAIANKNWTPAPASKAAQRPARAKSGTVQSQSARAFVVSGPPAPGLSLVAN